jgi:hypothetical protein
LVKGPSGKPINIKTYIESKLEEAKKGKIIDIDIIYTSTFFTKKKLLVGIVLLFIIGLGVYNKNNLNFLRKSHKNSIKKQKNKKIC